MDLEMQERPVRFRNEQGAIAEQYSHLQALHVLDAIRETHPLPKASYESSIRAILQATEVALLNLGDLISRATIDVRNKSYDAAMIKISWMRGFHQVILKMSVMPNQFGGIQDTTAISKELKIIDSPAFQIYIESLRQFDTEILKDITSGQLPLEPLLAKKSLDDNKLHLFHLIRICNHETTVWENNLGTIVVPVLLSNYEEFVFPQDIQAAVYDTKLEKDSYYTQFRGLHQIPEILCAELNDHIEKAILQIRAKFLQGAYEHLSHANILSEGMLASLIPLIDNLTTSDYHEIRENLGLTSGSHSVNIHYHLFKDLYGQLWNELIRYISEGQSQIQAELDISVTLRKANENRFKDHASFLIYLLLNEMLKLNTFTHEWRNQHLHLPRNNVGGGYTKSLTGSADAIETVKKMRDAALSKDPMLPLIEVRSLTTIIEDTTSIPLTCYFRTQNSLDKKLLDVTGAITKERFRQVQERTGIFAEKSPFVPPSKHEV